MTKVIHRATAVSARAPELPGAGGPEAGAGGGRYGGDQPGDTRKRHGRDDGTRSAVSSVQLSPSENAEHMRDM